MSGFNAVQRDKAFFREFINKYDHKVLYGTDNCNWGLDQLLLSLNIDTKKIDNIMGINALRILS